MKKYIYFVVLIIFFSNSLFARVFEVGNKYIKIGVDNLTGRFMLETVEGDPDIPGDDGKNLLYKKIPPTSLTTVYINDEAFVFGSEKGNFKRRAEVRGDKIISEWSIRGINIIQEVSIVNGISTGREDNMRILYKVRSENRRSVKVGLRILLDTYLGDKDGSAFRIPGVGDINKEAEFFQDSVPTYFYSFDSFADPTVRSQGVLVGQGVVKPDKVVFASWDRLYDNLWDFVVDGNKEFKRVGTARYDSAVALYYEPMELEYNDIMFVSTLYGIYGVSFFSSEDLYMTLSVPATPKSPPIPVAVEVKNKNDGTLDKLALEIKIPEGFSLVEGENKTIEFVKVVSGENKKAIWHLTSKSIGGTFTVKVSGVATIGNNTQSIDAKKEFKINYVESLVVKKTEIVEDLEKEMDIKIEEKKAALVTDTNAVVVPKPKPKTKEKTRRKPVKYKPSDDELKLMAEIEALDKLIEEVNKKYEIMIEVYRNVYVTNQAMLTIDKDIEYYNTRMKEEQTSLSNAKAKLKGKK